MSYYRKSWEFQVTQYLPCTVCTELKPVAELGKHSTYVYGEGYIVDEQTCTACHEDHVKTAKAHVKEPD